VLLALAVLRQLLQQEGGPSDLLVVATARGAGHVPADVTHHGDVDALGLVGAALGRSAVPLAVLLAHVQQRQHGRLTSIGARRALDLPAHLALHRHGDADVLGGAAVLRGAAVVLLALAVLRQLLQQEGGPSDLLVVATARGAGHVPADVTHHGDVDALGLVGAALGRSAVPLAVLLAKCQVGSQIEYNRC